MAAKIIPFRLASGQKPWVLRVPNFEVTSYVPPGQDRPSAFYDVVWRLQPTTTSPGTRVALFWDFKLNDGSKFCDSKHAELLYAARCYLWTVLAPTESSANGASASVAAEFCRLRSLLIWMHANFIGRFRDLEQEDLDAYLDELRQDDEGTGAALCIRINSLIKLFSNSRRMSDSIGFEPWGGMPATSIAGVNWRRTTNRNNPLPDNTAEALFLGAWQWVHVFAEDVIAVRKLAAQIGRKTKRNGVWGGDTAYEKRYYRGICKLRAFRFSCIPGSIKPWRDPVEGLDDVRALVWRLIVACYSLIAGFSGMRFHEMIRLKAGCLRKFPEISADGTWEIWKVESRTLKSEGTLQGETRDWVIGGRPVGNDISLWGCVAVRTLQRLQAASGSNNNSLFLTAERGAILGLSQLTDKLNEFLRECQPTAAHATTHQFRRTFARWCVRYDSNAAAALVQQFGHAQMGWILGYVGREADLVGVFGEERARVIAADLVSMLTEPIAGTKRSEITQKRLKFLADFKTTKDFVSLVSGLARNKDLILIDNPWGVCYYTREHSACHGGESGPNLAIRNPKVCCGCDNLRGLPKHRGFHENRIQVNMSLLTAYPKAASIVRADWEKRISESREIVAALT